MQHLWTDLYCGATPGEQTSELESGRANVNSKGFSHPFLRLSNIEQNWLQLSLIHRSMAAITTLLCIHRDPGQLNLLKEKGYGLVTATTGSDGLRLLMSQSVDAIVLEYHLGLLNGAVVADEIKQVRPQLPIVMLVDHVELPQGALKSVDVLVAKADGAHSLLETIHAILRTKQTREYETALAEVLIPSTGVNTPIPSKRQILVVDDDPSVRETLALLLISAGYDVATAGDGFGALLQLRKMLPDVIVTDLDMPDMSGFELLSVVRRRFPRILTQAKSGG
jgi:CheY-like chemotaxis protein